MSQIYTGDRYAPSPACPTIVYFIPDCSMSFCVSYTKSGSLEIGTLTEKHRFSIDHHEL